jgi:hypothetical protein
VDGTGPRPPNTPKVLKEWRVGCEPSTGRRARHQPAGGAHAVRFGPDGRLRRSMTMPMATSVTPRAAERARPPSSRCILVPTPARSVTEAAVTKAAAGPTHRRDRAVRMGCATERSAGDPRQPMRNAGATSGMAARLPACMPWPVDSDRRMGPRHGSPTTTPTAAPNVATMPAATRSRPRRVDGVRGRGRRADWRWNSYD